LTNIILIYVPLTGYIAAVAHIYAAERCTIILICTVSVPHGEAAAKEVHPATITQGFLRHGAIVEAPTDVILGGDHVG